MKSTVLNQFLAMLDARLPLAMATEVRMLSKIRADYRFSAEQMYTYEDLQPLLQASATVSGLSEKELLVELASHMLHMLQQQSQCLNQYTNSQDYWQNLTEFMQSEDVQDFFDPEYHAFKIKKSDPQQTLIAYDSQAPLADFVAGWLLTSANIFAERYSLHTKLVNKSQHNALFTLKKL